MHIVETSQRENPLAIAVLESILRAEPYRLTGLTVDVLRSCLNFHRAEQMDNTVKAQFYADRAKSSHTSCLNLVAELASKTSLEDDEVEIIGASAGSSIAAGPSTSIKTEPMEDIAI